MEEIKSILNSLGKNIKKTSTEILKNTKLSMQLSSEEEKLKNLYIEIGKKVYEIYSYGGNIGPFFDEKYTQIKETENKIKEIKQKIEINKGQNKPTDNTNFNTQNNTTDNTNFNTQNNNMPDFKTCVSCGQTNKSSDTFCLKCGRYL